MRHSRLGFIPLVLAVGAIASCSKENDGGGNTQVPANPVIIKVDGMQKGPGGKT